MESIALLPLFGTEEQNKEIMESVKKPAAHFFMAFRWYNGCIQRDRKSYRWEQGIQSVSSLSGARISTDAVVEVHPNKVPIRINSVKPPQFPNNDSSEPPLVFDAGIPHVVVDPENDLVCLSSFGSDWNPDETFSGGNACRHKSPLARLRRLGLAVPPLIRKSNIVQCKDCKQEMDEAPHHLAWASNAPEYCAPCVGSWVCYFRNLEQVFLIVLGLTRAKPGDKVLVYRFGEEELVEDMLKATKYSTRGNRFPKSFERDVEGASLIGVETTENFGSDGSSRCFEGNGITLYEARSQEIDDTEQPCPFQSFLETLFIEFCASRRCVSEQGGGMFDYEWGLEDFPACPPPETASIASGVVEFRVLTYQLSDGLAGDSGNT